LFAKHKSRDLYWVFCKKLCQILWRNQTIILPGKFVVYGNAFWGEYLSFILPHGADEQKNNSYCTNGQPFYVFARHIGLILKLVYLKTE